MPRDGLGDRSVHRRTVLIGTYTSLGFALTRLLLIRSISIFIDCMVKTLISRKVRRTRRPHHTDISLLASFTKIVN
uniref:Uncharacterized protein n=1 Tax=Kalanchoe fedtschenkoi TaxID=63787 RepID=A0A7N0U6I4_KALFE